MKIKKVPNSKTKKKTKLLILKQLHATTNPPALPPHPEALKNQRKNKNKLSVTGGGAWKVFELSANLRLNCLQSNVENREKVNG